MESIETHGHKNVARVLVGNKIDMESDRTVSKEEAQKLSMSYGTTFHECSAKKNIGLKETFDDIFEQTYSKKYGKQKEGNEDARPNPSMKLNQ